MTKCGRYGVDRDAFDYSPRTIRRSIERSLARLNSDYLDVVYLHDIEFVAEEIMPRASGNHLAALGAEAEAYGLKDGLESRVWGKGDQTVLDAFNELRKLQSEGVIRQIGLTGYYILFTHVFFSAVLTSVLTQDTHSQPSSDSPSSSCTPRPTNPSTSSSPTHTPTSKTPPSPPSHPPSARAHASRSSSLPRR